MGYSQLIIKLSCFKVQRIWGNNDKEIMNIYHDINQEIQDVAPWIEESLIPSQLPSITWRELLLWACRLRRRVRVVGPSMRPLLEPGDEVLVDTNAYRQAKPKIGEIVLALHPEQENLEIIKRITEVFQDNRYFLKGDNLTSSTDSRSFGAVDLTSLRGRVTCRFA